jgi:hypothetical protein
MMKGSDKLPLLVNALVVKITTTLQWRHERLSLRHLPNIN